MTYSKLELTRWNKVKAFINMVNIRLEQDSSLVLGYRGDFLSHRGMRFTISESRLINYFNGADRFCKEISIIDDNCTFVVFSLSEQGHDCMSDIMKELKRDIKLYREIKL
jgi:hypothetical protein